MADVKVGDRVRLIDERTTITVHQVHAEGVAGLDERYQWRAIRFNRLRQTKETP